MSYVWHGNQRGNPPLSLPSVLPLSMAIIHIYIYSSRAVPTILCFNLWAYHNIYIYTTERYTIAMNIVRYRDIQHVLLPNIPYSDN